MTDTKNTTLNSPSANIDKHANHSGTVTLDQIISTMQALGLTVISDHPVVSPSEAFSVKGANDEIVSRELPWVSVEPLAHTTPLPSEAGSGPRSDLMDAILHDLAAKSQPMPTIKPEVSPTIIVEGATACVVSPVSTAAATPAPTAGVDAGAGVANATTAEPLAAVPATAVPAVAVADATVPAVTTPAVAAAAAPALPAAALAAPLPRACKIPGRIPVDPNTVFNFDGDELDCNVAGPSTAVDAAADSVVGAATSGGYHCSSCGAHNGIRLQVDGDGPFYVVTAGLKVGVFARWHCIQPLISGVPHASLQKYPTKEGAITAFKAAVAEGNVVVCTFRH